jgi:hypothetical protein
VDFAELWSCAHGRVPHTTCSNSGGSGPDKWSCVLQRAARAFSCDFVRQTRTHSRCSAQRPGLRAAVAACRCGVAASADVPHRRQCRQGGVIHRSGCDASLAITSDRVDCTVVPRGVHPCMRASCNRAPSHPLIPPHMSSTDIARRQPVPPPHTHTLLLSGDQPEEFEDSASQPCADARSEAVSGSITNSWA